MMKSFNLLVRETTEQELFDHVCKHLADQQTPAKNSSGSCVYRLGKMSCAIGGCFSEDHYDYDMDVGGSMSADTLIDRFFPEAGHLKDISNKLQNAHDNSNNLNNLVPMLLLIASDHDLNHEAINLIKEWKNWRMV